MKIINLSEIFQDQGRGSTRELRGGRENVWKMFALSEMFDSFAGIRDKALKVMFSSYCCESKAATKTKKNQEMPMSKCC